MLTYSEALEYARSRDVVLPVEYYGLIWEKYRAFGFSIAGIASIDQLQRVKDSLDRALKNGETFDAWKRRQSVQSLMLPKGRLDNIFRTNIQGAYEAGRCNVLQRFPYLEYSAVNDSRTRPSHAAMDGTLLPANHPWWKTHRPPNGYRCRCTVIGVTEEQAKKRGVTSVPAAGPDQGWDYSICKDGQQEGLVRSIDERRRKCGHTLSGSLIALEPLWCENTRLQESLQAFREAITGWGEREKLLRTVMGEKAFSAHAKEVERAAAAAGIELHQGVMLRAYTDRHHYINSDELSIFAGMNTLARQIAHPELALTFTDDELFRLGVLILMMDESILALPANPGYYWRGVDLAQMAKELQFRWKQAHRRGRVAQYNGFTSAMWLEGAQYGGIQYQMRLESARNIQAFSVDGEPEAVLPRGVQIRADGFWNGYWQLHEVAEVKTVKKTRQLSAHEEQVIEWMIEDGYTREKAERLLVEAEETRKRWAEERKKPVSEERMRKLQNIYERMQVEATAGFE